MYGSMVYHAIKGVLVQEFKDLSGGLLRFARSEWGLLHFATSPGKSPHVLLTNHSLPTTPHLSLYRRKIIMELLHQIFATAATSEHFKAAMEHFRNLPCPDHIKSRKGAWCAPFRPLQQPPQAQQKWRKILQRHYAIPPNIG